MTLLKPYSVDRRGNNPYNCGLTLTCPQRPQVSSEPFDNLQSRPASRETPLGTVQREFWPVEMNLRTALGDCVITNPKRDPYIEIFVVALGGKRSLWTEFEMRAAGILGVRQRDAREQTRYMDASKAKLLGAKIFANNSELFKKLAQ